MNDEALIPKNPLLFEELMRPGIIETIPVSDPRWRKILSAKRREISFKILRRNLLAAFHLTKPLSGFRSPDYVKRRYNEIWTRQVVAAGKMGKAIHVMWRETGYVVESGTVKRPHLERLMHVISLLKPKSILEVGSGIGQDLFAIAGAFPEIHLTGLELSDSGVRAAQAVQNLEEMPSDNANYGAQPHLDSKAFKRINFQQGSAMEMPFADNSFDLVFSCMAIEQMKMIQDEVFKEIARVCSGHAVFIEPFSDFSQTELQRSAAMKKNHFCEPVSCLHSFGLVPLAKFSDWPQKIDEGIGLVVARKVD